MTCTHTPPHLPGFTGADVQLFVAPRYPMMALTPAEAADIRDELEAAGFSPDALVVMLRPDGLGLAPGTDPYRAAQARARACQLHVCSTVRSRI